MNRKFELLAPGGDIDSVKAAIASGADAVYCGLNKFNARNRAVNISFEDLQGILRLAHQHNCEIYITLNIIIVESEIPDLIRFLNKLINTNIDGLIIQDLGLFYILNTYFMGFNIHASTQLTTHNPGQVKFLSRMNASRINLSRELNLTEIKHLNSIAHKNNLLSEVFVHGSYCISFSGVCYMSSVHGGNSGNRGRCSQPCRDQYLLTPSGKNFPLNLKDNSAFLNLKELYEAGVDAVKIEGRIKKFPYVYTVVEAYRKQIQNMFKETLSPDRSVLYKVFNRDFSSGFLEGKIHKSMFIDNPRNHSAIYLSEQKGSSAEKNPDRAKKEVFEESENIRIHVKRIIDKLSIEKQPVSLSVSGKVGDLLKVSVKTRDDKFVEVSESKLIHTEKNKLDSDVLFQRFKSINDTEYYIENTDLKNLQKNVFIPFKELTAIKKRIVLKISGLKKTVPPIKLPFITKQNTIEIPPKLSVLISSEKDLNLCSETSADIYFQLPNSFQHNRVDFVKLFKDNEKLIPWFPSVLIGKEYDSALKLLQQINVKQIVTNNTGIAYEADKHGIPWIAGPFLNIVNSYSLLALKAFSNCIGSFISNEISKFQIKGIKRPKDFKFYYSMYHPIELMVSRQCLFHQVTGCDKDEIDEACIQLCEKSATITNLKKNSFYIEKSTGNYNRIYNEYNFLNSDIIPDIPGFFSGFFVDLRDIKTKTKVELKKTELVKIFEQHIRGNATATKQLEHHVAHTINTPYKKGI